MGFFSPEQVAALAAGVVRCDFLVEMRFASETIRVHNGNRPFVSGGHDWMPLHGTGGIDGLTIGGTPDSSRVTLTLAGLPGSDLLALALDGTPEAFQRLAVIFLQFFDAAFQPVGAPLAFYWGFMQPPTVSQSAASQEAGATGTITVELENAFFNRSLPPGGRYTDRDQQSRNPGDLFLQFTPELLFKTFTYPDY